MCYLRKNSLFQDLQTLESIEEVLVLTEEERLTHAIGELHVDWVITKDHETIMIHIVDFYQSLYKNSGVPRPLL
jgi:hypothetical protein